MCGAERPKKVRWTRPFLLPLKPLDPDAAQQAFVDIAEDSHSPEEVNKILSLTDNMPLAINLVAHLVDLDGCSNVLARWEGDKTSLISEGFDKRSNLNLSISLSLSSPRLKSVPHSDDLLSLLSILPDGILDVDLVQSMLPIDNILACKAALIRTALAYSDEHKRLKALVPIREYMHKIKPPKDYLIRPLLKHFQGLLELYQQSQGTPMSSVVVGQISSNLANIQNVLRNGLQQDHPDLKDSISSVLHLNLFSRVIGRGTIPLLGDLQNVLPHSCDHRIKAAFITELFGSWHHYGISNPETLVAQGLQNCEQFDDPDLKCRFSFEALFVLTDIISKVDSTLFLHSIIRKTSMSPLP
jgi:hypothetical protein